MVKQKYPELYEKIQEAVKRGQWIPDGAAWVEPDTNLSSGESLIRQLVHGKRFFRDEFGVDCELFMAAGCFLAIQAHCRRSCWAAACRIFPHRRSFGLTMAGKHSRTTLLFGKASTAPRLKHIFHNDYTSEGQTENGDPTLERTRAKRWLSQPACFPFGYGDGGGAAPHPGNIWNMLGG
jgi:alpha-mannosidase